MPARILSVIALLWGAGVSWLYYRLFPFTGLVAGQPSISYAGLAPEVIGSTVCFVGYAAAALGWGIFFFRNDTALQRLDRALFSLAAGFGLLSLAILAGGACGIISRWYYGVLLSAGILNLLLNLRSFPKIRFSAPSLLLFFFSLPPLLISFIAALAPPTQFDSLVYHLALPARYIAAGKIIRVQESIFAAFPQNMEMLFMSALTVRSDMLANLIAWLFLPLNGFLIFSLGRRYFSKETAVSAAIIWFTMPAALFLSTGTYVDLALSFYVTASFYALLLWTENRRIFWIISAGVFGGLACGVKYTAVIPVFLAAGIAYLSNRSLRAVAVLLFSAMIVFLPWLMKNMVLYNNPIAPWGTGWFMHSVISPGVAAGYFSHIAAHGLPFNSIGDLLRLPWNLTAYGYKFGGAFDILGPGLLIFLPVLFLQCKIDRIRLFFLLFIASHIVVWLCTGKVLRFLFPVLPVICILAGCGFSALCTAEKAVKISACALLAVMIAHNLLFFQWAMRDIDPYSFVFGGEPRDQYLARKVNSYAALRTAVNTLPPDSKVLFWGETRGYYCAVPAVVPTVFNPNPLTEFLNSAGTAAGARTYLQSAGITHILVNTHEFNRLNYAVTLSSSAKVVYDQFTAEHTDRMYQDLYSHILAIH